MHNMYIHITYVGLKYDLFSLKILKPVLKVALSLVIFIVKKNVKLFQQHHLGKPCSRSCDVILPALPKPRKARN